jgi:type II restriction/modification system DNA methylase subunit YeeA
MGKHLQNAEQKGDMELIFAKVNGAGVMDYVAAWYLKAATYLKSYQTEDKDLPKTRCAFVSTNSISQGEQVCILWGELFNKFQVKIHFAHRTFKWGNEAKGNAAVHVVIIGFSNFDIIDKFIYEYEDIKSPLEPFRDFRSARVK